MKRVLLLAFLLSLSGCPELPNMKDDDGAPASANDVQKTMVWAWGSDALDGHEILVNESVSLSKTAQIIGGAASEFEAQTLIVHDIDNKAVDSQGNPVNQYNILIGTASPPVDGNQKPPIWTDHPYEFPRSTTSTAQSFGGVLQKIQSGPGIFSVHTMDATAPNLSIHNMLTYYKACEPAPQYNWFPSCFNLRSWTSLEPAPLFLLNNPKEPNCGGLKNCQMNVNHVAFDLVSEVYDQEHNSTNRVKTLFHLQFSPDVPYLSRLVSLCFQGLNQPVHFVSTVRPLLL
jgi:hypothetical protein